MILLHDWIAGRVRTPGRFWRTVRRIDERSIDLATLWVRLIMLALCVLFMVAMSGCANYATVEIAHTSHPLAGRPFTDRTDEDSLDRVNGCVGRERAGWYAEGCVGYKYGDGGFVGPRMTFDGRVGRKFRFGEQP